MTKEVRGRKGRREGQFAVLSSLRYHREPNSLTSMGLKCVCVVGGGGGEAGQIINNKPVSKTYSIFDADRY